jgi:ribosomal protein S17
MKQSIGYNITEFPESVSKTDKKSPFSGNVSIRGKTFVGKVVSDAMNKTVKVEWDNTVVSPKYRRYLKTKTKVAAHNPEEINAKKDDTVLIAETRPLS